MALIITGIVIQLLGLAVQVVELRQKRRGRPTTIETPSPGHGGMPQGAPGQARMTVPGGSKPPADG